MKIDTEIYKEKLLSDDSKVRIESIQQLAYSQNTKELEFLMNTVFKKRIGNGPANAIKALGNSQNIAAVDILITFYTLAHSNEKRLIIESLLKLGVFKRFFPSNQGHKNITEQLWTLLCGCSSNQLKNYLVMKPEEFKEKLDFAWKTTKHWRK